MYLLDTKVELEGPGDSPNAHRRWVLQLVPHGFNDRGGVLTIVLSTALELHLVAIAVKPHALLIDHAEGLLNHLFEGPADCHHLADTLHAGAHLLIDSRELSQVPTRDLRNHVVERRLEAG